MYESVTVIDSSKDVIVVVASVSAVSVYTASPARVFPDGVPALAKNVSASSVCAWKIADVVADVNEVGTVSVSVSLINEPPEAVAITPSLLDVIDALPVQPVVLKVPEDVAVFWDASRL